MTHPEEIHWIGPEQNTAQEEEERTPGLGTLTKDESPNIKKYREESVPPPLLLLQVLDNVLVAVLGCKLQWSLPISVSRLQLHRALNIKPLSLLSVSSMRGVARVLPWRRGV